MSFSIGRIALAACVAVSFGTQGLDGGDDYDASNDTEGAGPAYFGFVRDHRGSPVSDAQVILRPKMGDPVPIKTNVPGPPPFTQASWQTRASSREWSHANPSLPQRT